jgi:Bacterial dnaA protein helix-turn-helix
VSEVDAILQRYKEIKERFRNPTQVVEDSGINLRKPKGVKGTVIPLAPPTPPPPVPISLPPPQRYLTLRSTFEISAEELGVTPELIKSKSRKKNVVFPRQIAIYVATKQKRWPLEWIARYVQLDHSTIYYSCERIIQLIESDGQLRNKIEAIEHKLSLLPASAIPAHNKPYLDEGAEGNVQEQGLFVMD